MMSGPIISLCLPTNGVIEWVFPVLDSIYQQGVELDKFEVIVTNNGDNLEFHKQMLDYASKYDNLIYKKTDAYMFHNQLETLKLASGNYFKFVNHRAVFTNGALKHLINVIQENIHEKPIMFFSNGVLKNQAYLLESFDDYVATLGRFASWTTGVGIWKSDYDNLPRELHIDKISPHSCILFANRDRDNYMIDNYLFSKELDLDQSKKGTYDLFKAFGVEELTITLNLFIDGSITARTFKTVKKDYKTFLKDLYFEYKILKHSCSYDLNGFSESMGIFFTKRQIVIGTWLSIPRRILHKIGNKLVRK